MSCNTCTFNHTKDSHNNCSTNCGARSFGSVKLSVFDWLANTQLPGGQEFFDDLEFSNGPDFPENIACGVLSEDAVYDLMGEHFETAISLLDLSSAMLKER